MFQYREIEMIDELQRGWKKVLLQDRPSFFLRDKISDLISFYFSLRTMYQQPFTNYAFTFP